MEQLLREGERVHVKVEKVSNGVLVARVLSETVYPGMTSFHLPADQEQVLKEEMRDFAKSNFSALPPVEGDVIHKLVLFKDRDGLVNRGLVEKLRDNGSLLIRNIDTRVVTISVPPCDVRSLPNNYGIRTWPPSILQLKLAQLKPLTMPIVNGMLSSKTKVDTERYDRAADEYVRQMVKNTGDVVCQVRSMNSAGVYSVLAWITNSPADEPVNINEALVKKNFARVLREGERNSPPAPPAAAAAAAAAAAPNRGIGQVAPAFNVSLFKRKIPVQPLVIGAEDLHPVSRVEECNFYPRIEKQYIKSRGKGHTDLSNAQRYAWPLINQGRDSVFIFPPENTRRTELAFLIPVLSLVIKGTYARFPHNYSPKVLIIVPSCSDADLLVSYCKQSFDEATKLSMSVRKAYAKSKLTPHAELWNQQDLLVMTPDTLVEVYKEHIPDDNRPSDYFSNTCHVILHKSHDLFVHHLDAMRTILNTLTQERSEQDYTHICQLLLFSNKWLPVFHNVARTFMSQPVIVIQNRTEAAIFGGVTTHVDEYQDEALKLDALICTARKLTDQQRKVALFTGQDSVERYAEALRCKAVPSYTLDDDGMNIQRFSKGSVMVISDRVGEIYQVSDCNAILHADLPSSLISFHNRLSFCEEYYTGMASAAECLSCFFLVADEKVENVSNLARHLSRYGTELLPSLKEKAEEGERLRQQRKSTEPLCPYLRQYGACSILTCPTRHEVLEQDAPGSNLKLLQIPLRGRVQVYITAVADGNRFYGRLVSVDRGGSCENANEAFFRFHADLQRYFNKPIPADEDKLAKGLVVAVQEKSSGEYYRAEIKAVRYNADVHGRLDGVTVHCIDTGHDGFYPLDRTFRLPHRMQHQARFSTEIIVCGVQPVEHDRHFASYCTKKLQDSVIGEVLEGNIELALDNCLWVKTLEKRQLLKSLKLMSSELSVKKLIIDSMFGIPNPEHIKLLRAKVRAALPDDVPPEESKITTPVVSVDAHARHLVCISHVNSPTDFYVNLVDNLDRLEEMDEAINNPAFLNSIRPGWLPGGTVCIARYSKDNRWYRGEVRRTWHDRYHIFYPDYGNEDRAVPSDMVKTIPPHFLELPFQAVHCCLADISAPDGWSSTHGTRLTDLTHDEDMLLDVMTTPSPDLAEGQLMVKLLYSSDEEPLVDVLCREGIGMNHTHIDSSAFAENFYKLYKSKDDYELLCAAESLQHDICSSSPCSSTDVATLCRLIKLHLQDEDLIVHLLPALLHTFAGEPKSVCQVLLAEGTLELLIEKLCCFSLTHKHIANILSIAVASNDEIITLIEETKCVKWLCELCVYKDEQSEKLVAVLQAIRALVTQSQVIRRELRAQGHVVTFVKFLRDASDPCLEEMFLLLASLLPLDGGSFLRAFREESGLREVCRATRRTWSPKLINILNIFNRDEDFSLMKREGLDEWFKELKNKRGKNFEIYFACQNFIKKISSHRVKEEEEEDEIPTPPPMIRVPITQPIDQPCEDKVDQIMHPNVQWYQRKRVVVVSIQLQDVGNHKLILKEGGRILHFSAWHAGSFYNINYKLHGRATKLEGTVHSSELLVFLEKADPGTEWPALLAEKRGNVKLDFERACEPEDWTDSEGEDEPKPVPVPCPDNVEICIGGAESEDEYMTEEEEIGDDFATSVFRHHNPNNLDSDDMDGLE